MPLPMWRCMPSRAQSCLTVPFLPSGHWLGTRFVSQNRGNSGSSLEPSPGMENDANQYWAWFDSAFAPMPGWAGSMNSVQAAASRNASVCPCKKNGIDTRLYTIIYSTLKILKHRTMNKALCCGWAPWQPRRFTASIRSQRYALWAQSLDRLMRHTWLSLKIKDLEDHRLTCRFLVLIIQLFRYPIWIHIRHLC